MAKNELLKKIELLNEYEAMLEELKAEADEIRNDIKAEMEARNVEEMEVDQYIVRFRSVLSTRFDTKRFKADHADLYEAYKKPSEYMRFTVN